MTDTPDDKNEELLRLQEAVARQGRQIKDLKARQGLPSDSSVSVVDPTPPSPPASASQPVGPPRSPSPAAPPGPRPIPRRVGAKAPIPVTARPAGEADIYGIRPPAERPLSQYYREMDEESDNILRAARLPAWALSAFMHALAVVALALLTWPEAEPDGVIIQASILPEQAEFFDEPVENEFDSPIDSPLEAPMEFQDISPLAPTEIVALTPSGMGPPAELGINTVELDPGMVGDAGATFFDIPAAGSKFVFIIDASGSMEGPRLKAAKEELMRAIREMHEYQSFYVIFFNNNALRMFGVGRPHRDFAEATKHNIERLQEFVDRVRATGGTFPAEAVRFGFNLKPHAVFLLSDGDFSDGKQTDNFLNEVNVPGYVFKDRKVPVHTIAIEDKTAGKRLERIARDHDGKFKMVP